MLIICLYTVNDLIVRTPNTEFTILSYPLIKRSKSFAKLCNQGDLNGRIKLALFVIFVTYFIFFPF